MPEAQFQAGGKHDLSHYHYTIITKHNAACRTKALTITSLLASPDTGAPARAYATSSHTIFISTYFPPHDVHSAMASYRAALELEGKEFPFLAFYNHDGESDDKGLQWLAAATTKIHPVLHRAVTQRYVPAAPNTDSHCILEVVGVNPLPNEANRERLEAIFNHYGIPDMARRSSTWVRDDQFRYAIKVFSENESLLK